jgi:hypothetical protein
MCTELVRTRLQEAAYGAQWAAALPSSDRARQLLACHGSLVPLSQCRSYLDAIRAEDWFAAAFSTHAATTLRVTGGRGPSSADRDARTIKIGIDDRRSPTTCEHACLHELAHLVTPDHGPDHHPREPPNADDDTAGHHHAWRANFVFLVQMTLGRPASTRLRAEFNHWGLPTN